MKDYIIIKRPNATLTLKQNYHNFFYILFLFFAIIIFSGIGFSFILNNKIPFYYSFALIVPFFFSTLFYLMPEILIKPILFAKSHKDSIYYKEIKFIEDLNQILDNCVIEKLKYENNNKVPVSKLGKYIKFNNY